MLLDQRAELIQGIKGQKLNAATVIDVTFTWLRHGPRHNAVRAAIAIRDWQPNALTVFIDQDIIHAPGINADAVDPNALIADFLQPQTNVVFQAIDVSGYGVYCRNAPALRVHWMHRDQQRHNGEES